jgi:hypothetical protein
MNYALLLFQRPKIILTFLILVSKQSIMLASFSSECCAGQ